MAESPTSRFGVFGKDCDARVESVQFGMYRRLCTLCTRKRLDNAHPSLKPSYLTAVKVSFVSIRWHKNSQI
jgi:hypothetical protein